MGMLRDDPGGHFQKGYSDGAAGKPFNSPAIPAPSRPQTSALIPKFSENPAGWFLAVLIVVEFWVLWQLIKAPFQLVGSLMRGEKPSPWVIVKNVIVAGLAIALVWWVPHLNEMRGSGGVAANQQFTTSPLAHELIGAWSDQNETVQFMPDGSLIEVNPEGTFRGSYSLSGSDIILTFPGLVTTTDRVVGFTGGVLKYYVISRIGANGADNSILGEKDRLRTLAKRN